MLSQAGGDQRPGWGNGTLKTAGLEDNLGLLDKTVQIAVVNCYFHWIDSKITFLSPYFAWEVKYYPRLHISCSVIFINKTSKYK